jgi:hypothetical protein
MKNTYLIAKYTPDLLRREPRNIGIILHDEQGWRARFVGEVPDGDLDGRKLRAFGSAEAYREWYRFWTTSIVRGVPCHGVRNLVPPDSSEFVDAICAASTEQYLLEAGPPSVIPASFGSGKQLLDFLFARIVSGEEIPAEDAALEDRMQQIIQAFNLKGPQFMKNYELPVVDPDNTLDRLVFSYAYLNGVVRLYQKVPIVASTYEAQSVQTAVHSALYSFLQAKELEADCERVALLHTKPDQGNSELVDRVRRVLGKQTDSVVDVADGAEVEAEFGRRAI